MIMSLPKMGTNFNSNLKNQIMKTFYLNNSAKHHVNEYTNSEGDHYSDLISYETRVASYNHETNQISIYGWFSNTTAKHINAFLEFYGFEKCTKQQMLNYK